jgi:multisubunit Na+/H+ antiporter MnhG subunit
MEEDTGTFDEGAATAPIGREGSYAAREETRVDVADRGYESYGARAGDDRYAGSSGTSETRPFLATSEFLATLLAIVALAITAAATNVVNARLTWMLIAAMVVGYVISRGLAKAGSASRSVDPRDAFPRRAPAARPTAEYGPWGALGAQFAAARMGRRSETRPFFMTSEFVGTGLTILALVLTAASMTNLGARLTWILITAMVVTYAVSRGVAKAGTASHSVDPRERLMQADQETAPFFMTSEFVGTTLAILAIAISAATMRVLDVRLTWILITAMVCGYVLSRGIAKIGIGRQAFDPRDRLMEHRSSR